LVYEGWGKGNREELHNLYPYYYWGYQMKKNEIVGASSAYGKVERRKQGFIENADGKSPLGRLRRRW
jgi:hypothetical protein